MMGDASRGWIDNYLLLHILLVFMHIICDRPACKHEWEYTGESKFFAVCPMCRKQVKLPSPDKETKSE